MGATEHLSSYQLVAVGRDVVWKVSDDVVVDLTRRPGQQVIAQMVRILDAFRGLQDREVVPLYRPKPGVAVDQTRAIRDSGMHHIRYRHDTRRGVDGLALAMAAVMAAIRPVVRELHDAHGQRLVEIQAIQPTRRYKITDPRVDPPPYWPRHAGGVTRPRGRRSNNDD